MATKDYKIIWKREADNLLRRRGNLMLEKIHAEFESNPHKEALKFDLANNAFVTPVANRRYSVVWKMMPDGNVVEVSAVVPTRFVPEANIETLKERVKSIVLLESDGRVTLG